MGRGLGRPPSFASTHVSARIVAHFDAAGSIDALTLFAHPTAESTTDETGTTCMPPGRAVEVETTPASTGGGCGE